MTNPPFTQSFMANTALNLFPPLIRDDLLGDPDFLDNFGLETKAIISLGDYGFSVENSKFFNSVRSVLESGNEVEMKDASDSTWHLRLEFEEEGLPKLTISSGKKTLCILHFGVLSPDASQRIHSLEKSASMLNLPHDNQNKWRSILKERPLDNAEISTFINDLHDTPVNKELSIHGDMQTQQLKISKFVPNSAPYFQRLIGIYDDSPSIMEYAKGSGRKFLQELFDWKAYEGTLFALLLSSHPALTAEMSIIFKDNEKLPEVYEFLLKYGDPLSRIGAIEFGLPLLNERPEIKPSLLKLIQEICSDEAGKIEKEFKLFSALFILIDGELTRIRLMADKPPFYRRLASLAQAALFHRQMAQYPIDCHRFFDQAHLDRGVNYYMQSFSDMRTEPRWQPDFGLPDTMKNGFLGRLLNAIDLFKENFDDEEIFHKVKEKIIQNTLKSNKLFDFFYPGPLEGNLEFSNPLPDELKDKIEELFHKKDEITPSTLFILINSAIFFKIKPGQAEKATITLKFLNHRLPKLKDKSHIFNILYGLAMVAAVSRSPDLSEELKILARRYRRDAQFGISTEEEIRISLVASAALEGIVEWRQFLGEWLTELAFGDLNTEEANVFHLLLIALLHSVPELWITCSRAEAALKSIVSR